MKDHLSKRLHAIIWDVDGVIADTEDFHRRAYNALFAELGLAARWSRDDYGERLGLASGRKFTEIMEMLGTPPDETTARKPMLYDRKTELFGTIFADAVRAGEIGPRPGVLRIVHEAHDAGVKLAAASTSRKPIVELVLSICLGKEPFGWFEAVCAEDDVTNKKPAPDVYLLAADRLGVDPARCVAVEDTTHGMRAALDAGIACIVTPGEYTRQDDIAGADLVVCDLDHGPSGPIDLHQLAALPAAPSTAGFRPASVVP